MQYLLVKGFDDLTNALNFDTPDCRVVGGCDAFTTKAAGGDKKLYKDIEHSLEEQYSSLLSFSARLPPRQAEQFGINLIRSSPFGSLNQVSSRRTFAYLIATLNASHPDYDFSHLLRPSDFRREKSLHHVMNTIDTTLYNLQPRATALVSEMPHWSTTPRANLPMTPTGRERWGPRMWQLIDKQMSLGQCSIYSYAPEEDPFTFGDGEDEDETAIWSLNYFFFNKNLKRVCYLYLRGLSMVGSADTPGGAKTPSSIATVRPKRPASGTWSLAGTSEGGEDTGRKRARFWLGDRADNAIVIGDDDEEELELYADKATDEDNANESEAHKGFEGLSDTASESPCPSSVKEGLSKDRDKAKGSAARRRSSSVRAASPGKGKARHHAQGTPTNDVE